MVPTTAAWPALAVASGGSACAEGSPNSGVVKVPAGGGWHQGEMSAVPLTLPLSILAVLAPN